MAFVDLVPFVIIHKFVAMGMFSVKVVYLPATSPARITPLAH